MAAHPRPGSADRSLTDRSSATPLGSTARADAEPPSHADLVALARAIQDAALARGLTIGTAESCTGGLVGHVLTEVPGSSAYYRGGVVAYADEVKVATLGVDGGLLRVHGAVSEPVAAAMAEGALARLGSDVSGAVTGIAGPVADESEKEVGLTYVAIAGVGETTVRRSVWGWDRSGNKRASAAALLELLLERLGGHGPARAER